MDLLATVRKEGSRGGTGDFKWSDVQNSSHREHYLGHSLHAPVGRWAKGKDLGWYAKGDAKDSDETEDSAEKASRERAEEIKRIKEAEQDALSRALGLPVPVRTNPNTEPLGDRGEVDKLVKEATIHDAGASGIGYGGGGGGLARPAQSEQVERIQGNAEKQDNELDYALKEYRRRHGQDRPGHRSRSRDRDRHHRRHGSRDRDREHRHRRRSRSRDRDRHRRRIPSPADREHGRQKDSRYRDRSRSPRRHDDRHDHRDGRRR